MKSLQGRTGNVLTDYEVRKLILRTFLKFIKTFKFSSWPSWNRTINYDLIRDETPRMVKENWILFNEYLFMKPQFRVNEQPGMLRKQRRGKSPKVLSTGDWTSIMDAARCSAAVFRQSLFVLTFYLFLNNYRLKGSFRDWLL